MDVGIIVLRLSVYVPSNDGRLFGGSVPAYKAFCYNNICKRSATDNV